jgi:iron complex outermembrane recepter protein
MTKRNVLMASCGLATMAIGFMAAPALAQSGGDSGVATLEARAEILVTARRREESVQDIPLSVSAFSAVQIERESLRRVEDLTRLTAGLTFDIGGFPNDTRPALRGMQAERGRPSVAVLLDGQDLSGENLSIAGGSAALRMGLIDLERIEVVKGPQATLYGRNAFAGAINYISKKPEFEFGGQVTGETGTGNLFGVTGSITGPVAPGILAFRLNGTIRDFGGYYRNPVNGGQLGAEHNEGIAGSLLFTPTSGLKIIGRIQYSKDTASDNPTAYIGANTRLQTPGGTYTAGPPGTPPTACPAVLVPPIFAACTRGTYVGVISATQANVQMGLNPITGQPPFGMKMDSTIGSVQVEWKTDNFGTFHYNFGYLKDHSTIEQDGDFSSFAAPAGNNILSLSVLQSLDYRNKHTDHVAYWTFDSDRFNLLIGGQKFNETSSLINTSQFWLRNPASNLAGPPFFLATAPLAVPTHPDVATRKTDYSAFFAGASVEIVKGLKLSADVRYNKDEITYNTLGLRRQDVSLSKLVPTCLPGFAQGATFSPSAPATSPPPGVVVACPQTGSINDSRWTPRFTAEYHVMPDVMVYGSYAEGFKPGGFNTNEQVSLTNQLYRAESVQTYELGIKSSWLDRRLVINMDVYRNNYKDQQIGVQLTSGNNVTTAGIVNAAAVIVKGFEADISWRIASPLTLGVNYAYTDARYENYIQGPPARALPAVVAACGVAAGQTSSDTNRAEAGNICADFSGKHVGKSPRHSLNVSALYERSMGDGKNLFAEINGSYRSERFTDESNLARLPAYWLWSLKVGAEIDNFSITMGVTNLLNSKVIQSAQRNIDFGKPEGFAPGRAFIAYLPNPRALNLRVGFKF